MAAGDLTSADIAVAFGFARSEAAAYRDASGAVQTAGAHTPRLDHAADGTPRGLLTGGGIELGGGDRITIDPLILPAGIIGPGAPTASDVTILHRFDDGSGEQRRAWYSRNVVGTINALMAQVGHHLELGVVTGFMPNSGGFIRLRGHEWLLPEVVVVQGAIIAGDGVGAGRPLIRCTAKSAT